MNYDQVTEVSIILSGEALKSAKREIRRTHGWRASWRYKGPHFRAGNGTALYVAVGAATVNVGCYGNDKNGASRSVEYIYPLSCVGRVKKVAL